MQVGEIFHGHCAEGLTGIGCRWGEATDRLGLIGGGGGAGENLVVVGDGACAACYWRQWWWWRWWLC